MDKSAGKRAFISASEERRIREGLASGDTVMPPFFRALEKRVYSRLGRNLDHLGETTEWYYPAAEYLSDAALLYLLQPEERLGSWLHGITLELIRKPAYDWAGPGFRDHSEPLTGHLETAHLCWAASAVLDLAPDLFDRQEIQEIRKALMEKGITLCSRWLGKNTHLANWRGILVSGIVVSAAVLDETGILDRYIPELDLCCQAFQPDGSYGESLQYGNYLAFALMLAYESVVRKYPERAAELDLSTYAKGIRWIAASMFYARPLANWVTEEPVARAANFNDSAALFRSSGDLLLHIAARHTHPKEAGLARWLFDQYYAPVPEQGPHELATFGMCNDWGFLTLPLLTAAPPPVSPPEAGLPEVSAFSNGHTFIRDAWNGKTVIAINGGGDPLNGPGHLHGDLNSFILVHNSERLLADPGHSCYRNLIHGLESSSQTHNTCTFLMDSDSLGLQEDRAKASLLEQKSILPRRRILPGGPGEPVDRQNKRLIVYRDREVSVVGSECSGAYGKPVELFERFWILAGSHALFIVDHIRASEPVSTVWNWVVNNRDGKTGTRMQDNSLEVLRGEAGMKLFHSGSGVPGYPAYGYMHDAYHVRPAQAGEGRPGSGLVFRFTEKKSALTRTAVHAIALDTPERIAEWRMKQDNGYITLESPGETWTLGFPEDAYLTLISGGIRRDIRRAGENYICSDPN
ncbi:MAG: hypothetical protein ABS46_03905 [Cytophagaceae bacterium SCN 52-12]|nr:MAG: hypothetical protein ABS46_03905 [Cytophagaceae bacterium SCN 52-12]